MDKFLRQDNESFLSEITAFTKKLLINSSMSKDIASQVSVALSTSIGELRNLRDFNEPKIYLIWYNSRLGRSESIADHLYRTFAKPTSVT